MTPTPTVFVVDDDKAVRDSIVLLFRSAEMAVESFASADEFLRSYQTDRPGCLVLDVSMPGTDGLELQRTLSEKRIRLPVIFITGHGDLSMSVRAFRAGALDFIEKPFDNERLLSSARQAIAHDLRLREVEAEEALLEEKERAQVTLQSMGDAVITTNAGGLVEYLNPIAEQLTGWSMLEARDQPVNTIFNIIDERSREPVVNVVSRCLQQGKAVSLDHHAALISRDGQEFAIEDSVAPIRSNSGELLGVVIVFKDVTQQRRLTKELAHNAGHDALTGLVNRREFERRLERAITSSRSHGRHHVLCYIDLDQFKAVNDTAGHAAGDELLRQVAVLFSEKVRERDTLARLGGDEFGLLLDNCPMDKAYEIAETLVAELRDFRFVWETHTFQIGASIGLVTINGCAETTAELLRAADSACYTAKKLGRNRVQLSQAEGCSEPRRHTEMMHTASLSNALEQQRFMLYSQPIVALVGGRHEIAHHELLVRLLDEAGEMVLPASFIPTAERHGLMSAVDRWVIHMGFHRYHELFADVPGTQIAINLSGNSLNDTTLLAYVDQQFAESGIAPERVCFEIAESAAIRNLNHARRFIHEMKKRGCHFALDHFGGGLSSLSYLKRLPVDYLKIEGAVVSNMLDNPIDHAMVAAINQIGHSMGIRTVAEWVESEAVITRLTEMGIDYAQGFALCSPSLLEGRVV